MDELIRASGILLHPTSFPGPHGIGDLGEAAYRFVDFLGEARQSLWQVLPLGPTGHGRLGDSPYASYSSFAGNPLLVSLDRLVEAGDLDPADLAGVPPFPLDKVDYGWVIHWKFPLLEKAARNFLAKAEARRKAEFETFCAEQAGWLEDYALYMAVKAFFDQQSDAEKTAGGVRKNWDKDIALRQPEAMARWQAEQAEAIAVIKVWQYYFFQQWTHLKRYANERGIQIIGDIPIFVAPDSADAWANPELFQLDEAGQPTVIAGVPPDYFSPTGQLWRNPLYDWPAMAAQGYQWWIERIQASLRLVDIIRIDHFRGFEAYWEIPAGEETAVNGRWVKGPGKKIFEAIKQALGELPILAEDLGVITPEVKDLRDHFGFPGMIILQFGFDDREAGGLGPTYSFLPHNHRYNTVVYTGTHDNNTTKGWYWERAEEDKDFIRRYLARSDDDIVWDFIRLAMASVSRFAIIPFQDVLNLGRDARMNTPGTLGGNWEWRCRAEALNTWVSSRLRELVHLYGRDPKLWQEKMSTFGEYWTVDKRPEPTKD